MIATRVTGDPVSGNNGLFYIYSDHLGSASLLVNSSNNPVAGGRTWYLPFGGYRPGSAPTQTITDRDFTGQRENMELGLLYYGARFYVPGLGRFASADSIIPNPANPQSYNRYSYVLNRALNFTDPTGHRECSIKDNDCSNPIPHPLGGGLVSFREDDVWESDAEKETFREGAAQVAQALFEVAGEEYNSPREVYRAVFGGAVEVRRVNDSCAGHFNQPTWTCFASWDDGINVYTNADGYIEGYVMWAMHELFHGFNANAGGQPYADLTANPIKVDGVTISPASGNVRALDGYLPGESGETDRTPYVNSWDDYSVGEDFADMGANWAAKSFASGEYGDARYNWMDRRMKGWISLAVANNQ